MYKANDGKGRVRHQQQLTKKPDQQYAHTESLSLTSLNTDTRKLSPDLQHLGHIRAVARGAALPTPFPLRRREAQLLFLISFFKSLASQCGGRGGLGILVF